MSKLEEYTDKGGQRLRLGYTTGSCAAAAAKAAALMLLSGQEVRHVRLMTPRGIELILEIEDIRESNPRLSGRWGDPPSGARHEEAQGSTPRLSCRSGDPPSGARHEEAQESTPRLSGRSGDPPSGARHEEAQESNPRFHGSGSFAAVSCAVRKDSGDDPDITNGALIYATVSLSDRPGIRIHGGEGVGRVTKPGLDQPVGNAAINSIPRRMIEAAVREAAEACGSLFREEEGDSLIILPEDPDTNQPGELSPALSGTENRPLRQSENPGYSTLEPEFMRPLLDERHVFGQPALCHGLDVTISVPGGRELAKKTFNPKLGIVGGISILGTSGIVDPMSDRALLDTIRTEISVRRSEGLTILAAAPGNYGKNFFLEKYDFSIDTAVTASNFIYDTVRMASEAGFSRMLFVGHIGKLVKVAGGIRNTHSQYGDHRMEILGEIMEDVIRGGDVPCLSIDDRKKELTECVSTDEAVRILAGYGLDKPVLAEMTRRIRSVMEDWADRKMQVEVIVFSNVSGELGRTPQAEEYVRELRQEMGEVKQGTVPPLKHGDGSCFIPKRSNRPD